MAVTPVLPRYTRYLLDALSRRELFQWLQIRPTLWWHAMLFRDAYNWAGISAHAPEVGPRKEREKGEKRVQVEN